MKRGKSRPGLGQYILDGHEPVVCINTLAWGAFMQDASRKVAFTQIEDIRVSTVFLGLDHNWGNEGPPILFETMIFGGKLNEDQWRYATWEEAEAGHVAAVELVKASLALAA